MDHMIWNGQSISRMTLGTVQLGLNYGIANQSGKPDLRTAQDILDTAAGLGINTLDTARQYGDSESVLGAWLRSRPAGSATPAIVTKFKLTCADDADESAVEQDVRSQLETSLQLLGLRQVPLYLLHNSQDLSRHESRLVPVLRRLVREGLIGAAGVSIYGPDDMDRILKYDVFRGIQAPMNLFDIRLAQSGSLKRLADAGMAVFVRSVYLQGLFFMKPEQLPANLADAGDLLADLHRIAESEGLSVMQMAVSYIRDMPGVTSLVVGAEKPEQIRENAALLNGPMISEHARGIIASRFGNLPERIINPGYWKR